MDIGDFEGCKALKRILPSLYSLHILMMLILPFSLPRPYQIYNLLLLTYLALRSLLTLAYTFKGAKEAHRLLSRQDSRMQLQVGSVHPSGQIESGKSSQETAVVPLLSQQPQFSYFSGVSANKQAVESDRSANNPNNNSLNGNNSLNSNSGKIISNNGSIISSNGSISSTHRFYHAFIVPNYKEDLSVLTDTLTQISKHPDSPSRFLLFLAMQAHEPGSSQKAQVLLEAFRPCFLAVNYTIHEMRPHEQKGKAANVSWCAEHMEEDYLLPMKIDPSRVMLTIIDADSWVPVAYIDEVDRELEERYEERHGLIFEPCQMFTLNHWEVPLFTRTYDLTHGLVHFSNLFSLFHTSFPLSNYSLSYSLAKRIGFWDTCPDAIGEDFHTTIKAFWKTKGAVKTVSVFTPFNQLNISTGRGYWADCSARFWQAERHGRGCADAAYCWNRLRNQGITRRTFLIMYQVIQITTLPAVLPWGMFAGVLMGSNPQLDETLSLLGSWLSILCTLCFVVSMWVYLGVCERASRVLYGLRNWSRGRVRWRGQARLECLLMFIPNIFLVTVPSATIAAFRVAFFSNDYEVAEKRVNH